MKKIRSLVFSTCIAVLFCAGNASAQSVKGQNFANLGIGVGSFGFSGTGGLPVTASFEHGFTDQISAGGFVSFIKRKLYAGYNYTYYVVGAKGSYHLNEALKLENPKLDVYGGLSLFYRGYKLKYKDGDLGAGLKANGGNLGIGIHAGGRYMFNNSVGAFGELGFGVSPLQLGVTFKL